MKTKELLREVFNLAVRLLGLVMLYQGVRVLALGFPDKDANFRALVFLVSACWMFYGAYPVAGWAYPKTKGDGGAAQPLDASLQKKADA